MNSGEIMHELQAIMQNLEDTKQVIIEQQEEIRELITQIQLMGVK